MEREDAVKSCVGNHALEARHLLLELIRIPSLSGHESEATSLCRDAFDAAGAECELVPLPLDLPDDPEYSSPGEPVSYEGRHNLLAWRRGIGGGRSVILQTHLDVVPAGDWADAFEPREQDGFVIGRGATDCKGCIVAIWLAMSALRDLSPKLAGDVQCQLVVEEEFGGNGALALIRQGYVADAAVIVEGSSLAIHPSNRGALWFRIELEGRATHMGRKHEGISAVDLACQVVEALREYELKIVKDSRGYPGYEKYEQPVQVNVGILNAGTWPSMVAGQAVLEGGVGFLPNRPMSQVKEELAQLLCSMPNEWIRDHHKLTFPKLHNDSYETDFNHPAVKTLAAAAEESGIAPDISGWNVSCDARLYAKVGGMPTIVFGPGSIADAHAKGERIEFDQILKAAEVLVRFVMRWCAI